MIQEHKIITEEFCTKASFLLSEVGNVSPLCVFIKDNKIFPVIAIGLSVYDYIPYANRMAKSANADAMFVIAEQTMVFLSAEDKDYESASKGLLSVHDRKTDSSDYLTLTYMTAAGEFVVMYSKIEQDLIGKKFVGDFKMDEGGTSNFLVPWR
jgi:hypothetical protein